MKICSKCKIKKELKDYYGDPRTPLGVQPCCKECFKIRAYEYRKTDNAQELLKKYKNKPEVKEKNRIQSSKFRSTQQGKEWWKKYRQTEKYKEYRRKYERIYARNPKAKLNDQFHGSNYRAKKRSTDDGTVTYESVVEKLKSQSYLCKICLCDLKKVKAHIDHIYPISLGGKHTINNIQWLCATCNIRKSNHV